MLKGCKVKISLDLHASAFSAISYMYKHEVRKQTLSSLED